MELHITGLRYAFPYQNMEFHITKILKEIIAQKQVIKRLKVAAVDCSGLSQFSPMQI